MRRLSVLFGLSAMICVTGCREETAMLVFVDTDISSIQTVYVEVIGRDGTPITTETMGDFQMQPRPARLTLVPAGEPGPFTLTVTGRDAGGADVLTQRAETRFESGQILFLRMYLYASCTSVAVTCAEGQTCNDGACIPVGRNGEGYGGTDPDGIEPAGICDPETCWEGCSADQPCDPVVQLTAGGEHSCALTAAGDLYCWGRNDSGQVGDGSLDDVLSPTAVMLPDALRVTCVSAGLQHTCAAGTRGGSPEDEDEVWCWGDNSDGQLGSSGGSTQPTPARAEGLDGLTAIPLVAAGGQHTCVINDGPVGDEILCTGNNDSGQLGSLAPSAVNQYAFDNGVSYVDITALEAGDQHSCFIMDGQRAVCWGESDAGRLGDGTSGAAHPNTASVLYAMDEITDDVTAIATGLSHTCVLNVAGEIHCAGSGGLGELGAGTMDVYYAMVQPAGPAEWTAVGAGYQQTCGIRSGALWCWGWSNGGALGVGVEPNEQPPTRVLRGEIPAGEAPTAITLGGGGGATHVCALAGGIVYCWGTNGSGEVGIGSTTPDPVTMPMRVLGPS